MASKRQPTIPGVSLSGPKAPVHFPTPPQVITVAESAFLTGTYLISVAADTVIHPRAKIESFAGSVFVGRRCIVHERSIVGAVGTAGNITEEGVTLGEGVTVEVGASIEAGETRIGDWTVVGAGSKVGRGAKVGKFCTLSPLTVVAAGEVIPDRTVVYSNGKLRTDERGGTAESRFKGQSNQIEVLKMMIPSSLAKFQTS